MSLTAEHPVACSQDAFDKMCDDIGFTPNEVRHMSENPHNLIQFPPGEDFGVEVRPSEIEGKGLFTKRHFKTGEMICPAAIAEMRTPAGRYTNHSDHPNSYFLCTPSGRVMMVAGRNITPDSELTVDYRQSREAAILAHQILNGD